MLLSCRGRSCARRQNQKNGPVNGRTELLGGLRAVNTLYLDEADIGICVSLATLVREVSTSADMVVSE